MKSVLYVLKISQREPKSKLQTMLMKPAIQVYGVRAKEGQSSKEQAEQLKRELLLHSELHLLVESLFDLPILMQIGLSQILFQMLLEPLTLILIQKETKFILLKEENGKQKRVVNVPFRVLHREVERPLLRDIFREITEGYCLDFLQVGNGNHFNSLQENQDCFQTLTVLRCRQLVQQNIINTLDHFYRQHKLNG